MPPRSHTMNTSNEPLATISGWKRDMSHRADMKLTMSSLGRVQTEKTKPFEGPVEMLRITPERNFTDNLNNTENRHY